MTRETGTVRAGRARVQQRALVLALVGLLAALAALAGCDARAGGSGSVATQPTATTTATATATAGPPRVLYQADWSHGADGWALPEHWSVQSGKLVSDEGADTPVVVPLPLTTENYTIEMEATVVSAIEPMSCSNSFGFYALDDAGQELYHAIIECITSPTSTAPRPPNYTLASSQLTARDSSDFATHDYTVTANPRVYRVRVHGRDVAFIPGGVPMGGVTAGVSLIPAHLQIASAGVRLVISRFVITTN